MKAVYFYGPKEIKVQEVPIPKITDDELLLKIKSAAICGTDLRIYKFGHFKIPQGTRRVLSHELAGEIVQVGKNVEGYTAGMRVAVAPNVGCGHCAMCVQGYNQLCADYQAFGISMDGGFQEYMRVPANAIAQGNVVRIPDALSFEEATLVEPFSCTYNAYESLHTKPGDNVLIIGAGPIGSCHVMIQKLAGAAKVMVADILDSRLEQIKQLGADVTINSANTDLKAEVRKQTDGLGADVIITANSVPELQALALELAAARGRINLFGGMPKEKELVTLNTNLIHYKELIVTATTGSSIQDYHQSMKIAASGNVPLGKIEIQKFGIDEAQQAFDFALSGAGSKVMIVNNN